MNFSTTSPNIANIQAHQNVVVVDRRVDHLHGLAFKAIGDLLECPTSLVLDRALDKLLDQLVSPL